MQVSEWIAQEVSALPENLQEEVLDFVGYLKAKRLSGSEESAWNSLSLSNALSGMENDIFPEYGETDLIEHWQ